MKCRVCRKPAQPEYKPFCSRHCADVDLAHWLRGDYVTSRPLAEGDLTDAETDDGHMDEGPPKH